MLQQLAASLVALSFQERIRIPDDKMKYYENLAEMYVGDDVSPDFYGKMHLIPLRYRCAVLTCQWAGVSSCFCVFDS